MIEIVVDYIIKHPLELLTIASGFFVVIFTGLTYFAIRAKPLVACKLKDHIRGESILMLTVYNVGKANAFNITIDIDPPINTAKDINGKFQTISKLQIPFLLPNEKEVQRLIKPKELAEKSYIIKATCYGKSRGIFKRFTKVTNESIIDCTDGGRLVNTEETLHGVVKQLKIIAKKFNP